MELERDVLQDEKEDFKTRRALPITTSSRKVNVRITCSVCFGACQNDMLPKQHRENNFQ